MRALMTLVLTVALAGCGFHLRGADYRLAFEQVNLEAGAVDPDLRRELELTLRGAGARAVHGRGEAPVTLLLSGEHADMRTISVGAQGRAAEYELQYTLRYALEDAGGKSLLEPQTVTQTRSLSFDNSEILGKEAEEKLLWRDMRRETAQQIVRRLAAVEAAVPAPAPPP